MRFGFFFLIQMLLGSTVVLAHPGALGEYPERIPGKTLQQIKAEWEPSPDDAWNEQELGALATELVTKWASLSDRDRKVKIEKLAAENRRGDYRKRFANLAQDLMDLQSSASDEEVSGYLGWRMEHLAKDDGYHEEAPAVSWDDKPEQRDQRTREWQEQRDQEARELSTRADLASAALRPHWLVQRGALEFKHRRFEQAASCFQRVVEAFPEHPRAEAARLMLARIRLDQWRQDEGQFRPNDAKLHQLQDAWWSANKTYHSTHPQGRFGVDLVGWEGGYFLESGNLSEALACFLQQCRDPAHPEVRRRAFQQIEWMLRRLIEVPNALETLPWDEIVQEPLVALRIGYLMLDCHSATDLGAIRFRRNGGDHRVLESLVPELINVRTASIKAWALLDAALARNERTYAGDKAAILQTLHGWSAVVRRQPGVALGLLQAEAAGVGADDVVLARLFALIQMAKQAEVVKAIEHFQQTHADSALNRGMLLRQADAWVDLGQTHQAFALLWTLMEGNEIATAQKDAESDPPLHLPGEAEQRLAALVTFAPLNQLALAAEAAAERPELRTVLCGALRVRHLSEWHFEESVKWSADSDFEHWIPHHSGHPEQASVLAERWRSEVAELQALAAQADTKASAWMEFGQKWQACLWKMLSGGTVYRTQPWLMARLPEPSHELRAHAAYLHIADATAAEMLDQRQELSHARRCFEKAVQLAVPDSAEWRWARERLHEVLRQRAEVSPYFRDRAVEMGDAKTAQALAATQPDLVPWTFQPSHTLGAWEPGKSALWQVEIDLAARLGNPGEKEDVEPWLRERALRQLMQRLKQTVSEGATLAKLSAIRDAVRRDAPALKAAALLNHLDDLSLLLGVSGVSSECFSAYASARLEGKPLALDDPLFVGVEDFVSFWNAAITPSVPITGEQGWRSRTAQTQVARMTAFLADYPNSPKREAALARLGINTLRQSRSHCGLVAERRVEKATTGYVGFVVERGLPFDLKAVQARIDDYSREFPEGRYQGEMQLIQGLAAAEAKDWKSALTLLTELLNDPKKQDLHLDASNTLCAIFMELLEATHRNQVKAAIEAVPQAKPMLLTFMRTPSCGWRLRIMQEWIESWAVGFVANEAFRKPPLKHHR